MRQHAPFQADDLRELDESLLSRASSVLAMEDVHDGNRDPNSVAMRHDVDGTTWKTRDAFRTAVLMAEWESARGFRSTYYMLHTAPYWTAQGFAKGLDRIAELGHEIGIHADALAESLRTGRDPDMILDEAIGKLRALGHPVRGVAGHGNPLCNRARAPGEITFANDEHFVECARPQEGEPDRLITRGNITLKLAPRPLADFGLEYEALQVAHTLGFKPFRISDSGGTWLNPGWEETVERWQSERASYPDLTFQTPQVRQLHLLQHPDWWSQAFSKVAAVL